MAVYVVTGKLGSGKTLVSVAKIREYLKEGRKVASNLDIDLSAMLGHSDKRSSYYRIPDKPSLADLEFIGIGNPTNDEKRNGLLVLDECGTWFNSRSWADKARQGVINWFLHARKLGWDIIFLIQDLSIMDKQARVALAEHVVYCRRTDRLTIPIIGTIFKFFWGDRLPMPKVHIALVRYGDERTSLIVDKWIYRGRDLYAAYDTRQVFSDFYESGVYQTLPSYYSHGRYKKPRGFNFYMRLTKIILRKYSRVLLASTALLSGSGLAFSYDLFSLKTLKARVDIIESQRKNSDSKPDLDYDFSGAIVVSYFALGDSVDYIIKLNSGENVRTSDLTQAGYAVNAASRCSVNLFTPEGDYVQIYCN